MKQRVLSSSSEYLVSGHAKTFLSTAGSQKAIDPAKLDQLSQQLARDGYVILESVVPVEQIERIENELRGLLPANGGRNAFYPIERPRPPFGAATIIAMTDFTANNGATVVIPGSHTWGQRSPTEQECAQAIPVIMPKGSMVLFLGTLWHSGGANSSDSPRLAVTAQYCAPWARQQENFSLSVPLERARQCSEHIQRMLGYSIHPPFMGMVDGMHPRRLLEVKSGADCSEV